MTTAQRYNDQTHARWVIWKIEREGYLADIAIIVRCDTILQSRI